MSPNNNNNFITTIKTEPIGSPKSIISLINTTKVINPTTQQINESNKIIVNNNNNLLSKESINLNENSNNLF